MQSTPIRRRKLSEEVAARLEAMIQEGGYQPGDQLPSERDLMKQFGVGRPAVREALFSLQTMGLVAVSSGERARVTRPTPKLVIESLAGAARLMLSEPDGIRHFQQARTFFEIGLARHAAEHASESDLRDLRRALEENRLSIGNIRRFEQTDMAFHYVLAVIPRNPIFTAIHAAIAEWLMEQRTITLSYPGQNEIAYRAHLAITEAIAARDPDRSERVIRAHLDQVAGLYWQVVGEQGGEHGGLRDHGGVSPEARGKGVVPPAD
jgi:GntR family transcriptional repressor for pyruvate dehydrogenase complex